MRPIPLPQTIKPHPPLTLYQYEYASRITLVATTVAAKLSLALLIQSLMAEGRSLIASQSLLVFIIAWGFTAIFTIAFGCNLPHPWDTTGKCLNLVGQDIVSYKATLLMTLAVRSQFTMPFGPSALLSMRS